MKLGKMERFILRYLWYYTVSTGRGRENHGYRSQILFVLYNLKHRNYKFSYKRNIKNHIPAKEYRALQVLVTRSTKSLETKGLVRRVLLQNDFFKSRRYAFFLTNSGSQEVKRLLGGKRIKGIAGVFFEDQ